jgi:hypothetical protein
MWNWAIARRGPAYVSVYRYAVPALAGIISFFLFGASLSGGQIAGAGIVFAGMALARYTCCEKSARGAGERDRASPVSGVRDCGARTSYSRRLHAVTDRAQKEFILIRAHRARVQ